MTFLQRVANSLLTVGYHYVFRDWIMIPKLEDILDKHFPDDPRPGRPSLIALEREAALAFQFGHHMLMDGMRPLSPNYIQIGMMNCRPPKDLPPKIKKFMDESGDEGVIYVSFGSVIQASQMPDELRIQLTSAFGQLKQKVLWKWETEEMKDKPDNVMLSKWLPQQDILAHPKLRLFITHGGQSSCQESLCHQKPMVSKLISYSIDPKHDFIKKSLM
jgi:glucuronosyltransferase